MNFNFLEFQYTDQIKTLVSTDLSGADKKNYVTNQSHTEFSTKNTQDTQTSDNKSFSELMNKLQKQKDSGQTQAKSDTPVAKDNAESKTGLLDIAALNAQITRILSAQTDQDLNAENTEAAVLLVTTQENAEEATASLIEALKSLQDKIKDQISEIGNKPGTQSRQEELSLLETISTHLDKILGSKDNILVITNQSPEDIARLQSFIFDLLSREIEKQDEEMLAALAAQWSELVPPLKEPQKTKTAADTAKNGEVTTLLSPNASKSQDTLDARHHSQERYDAKYTVEGRIEFGKQSTTDTEGGFRNILQGNIAKEAGIANTNTAQQSTMTTNAGARFLQNSSAGFETLFASTGDIAAYGSAAQTGVNQANALLQNIATNPVTQSSHATQAHPATQAVMVNIQRIAKGNENSNIRIQLDPPELGRVEVKMSIGKDNASKIVLTVEKPETYAMLQRDAQALERALQESGLDNHNELSFELADQDHSFNANDRGADSSGSSKGGDNGNAADDGEIIETSMDIQIDPETGRIRYNILA